MRAARIALPAGSVGAGGWTERLRAAGRYGLSMGTDLVPPRERECLQCGRHEAWDENAATWTIDGDAIGEVHCVHEWDINGEYSPFR